MQLIVECFKFDGKLLKIRKKWKKAGSVLKIPKYEFSHGHHCLNLII